MLYKKIQARKHASRIGLLLLFLWILPSLSHLYWHLSTRSTSIHFYEGKDIVISTLPRTGAYDPSASPVEIRGTYGDVFEPQKRGLDRAYDLIVLSATIDPLVQIDSLMVWTSNKLVREYFKYAYDDEQLIQSGIRNLIVEMTRENKRYIRALVGGYDFDENKLVSICEPILSEVPRNSKLWRAGVRWIAVLPLFNGERIINPSERTTLLRLNVRTAIGRLISGLGSEYRSMGIRIIGIPALAGTETLIDSHNYLTYFDSFNEILSGVEGRFNILTSSVERIYLISWDKWALSNNPQEGQRASNSLLKLHRIESFQQQGSVYVSYSLLVGFGFSFFFWIFKEHKGKKIHKSSLITVYFRPAVFFIGMELAALLLLIEKMRSLLTYSFLHFGDIAAVLFEILASGFFILLANILLRMKTESTQPVHRVN